MTDMGTTSVDLPGGITARAKITVDGGYRQDLTLSLIDSETEEVLETRSWSGSGNRTIGRWSFTTPPDGARLRVHVTHVTPGGRRDSGISIDGPMGSGDDRSLLVKTRDSYNFPHGLWDDLQVHLTWRETQVTTPLREFSFSRVRALEHKVHTFADLDAAIRLGMGLNLSSPIASTVPEFEAITVEPSGEGRPVRDHKYAVSELTELNDIARVLYAGFSASYNLSSARASFRKAEALRRSKHVLLGRIELIDGRQSSAYSGAGFPPLLAQIESDRASVRDKLRRVVHTVGSHYLGSYSSGHQFYLLVQIDRSQASAATEFHAALEVVYGSIRAGGSIDSEATELFKRSYVTVQGRLVSGAVSENVPRVVSGYREAFEFLAGYADREFSIDSCPIRGTARSVLHHLDPQTYPSIYAAWNP